ncbi:MAG: hypothetical protein ACKVQC_00975 [Elusimicrobiota bacterium]
MSIERAKSDLRKRLSEVKDEALRLENALLALGEDAVSLLEKSAEKALKKGFQRSAAWRAKIAASQRKRWADFRAKKAKAKKV